MILDEFEFDLFDDANVVLGKSDYGQSHLTSGPFANKKAE